MGIEVVLNIHTVKVNVKDKDDEGYNRAFVFMVGEGFGGVGIARSKQKAIKFALEDLTKKIGEYPEWLD